MTSTTAVSIFTRDPTAGADDAEVTGMLMGNFA